MYGNVAFKIMRNHVYIYIYQWLIKFTRLTTIYGQYLHHNYL